MYHASDLQTQTDNQTSILAHGSNDRRVIVAIIGPGVLAMFYIIRDFLIPLARLSVLFARFIFTQLLKLPPVIRRLPNIRYSKPRAINPIEPGRSPRWPEMSDDMYTNISAHLSSQQWTRGRDVVVNKASNTISVFDINKIFPYETLDAGDIPLFCEGLPVLPHCYNRQQQPHLRPQQLETSTAIADGLSGDNLRALNEFIPGILHIDYYLDRQVLVKLGSEAFDEAVKKLHGICFSAWNCVFIIVLFAEREAVPYVQDQIEEGVSQMLVSGSKVYNDMGEFSTVGVLLHPSPPKFAQTELPVQYLTVSAHSFMKKKNLSFPHWRSMLLGITVSCLARVPMLEPPFSDELINQLLLVRTAITLHSLMYGKFGRILGLHRFDGRVAVDHNISALMLTWLFLPIVVVRLVITYHLEYILPRSNFVCFMIAMVFEVGLTWEHVRRVAILEDGSTKHEPSGMVRSWFRPNLRNEMRIVGFTAYFPWKLVFLLSFLCRLLIKLFISPAWAPAFRFASFCFSWWDLVQFIWSYDWLFTFSLVGEPVMDGSNRRIGQIVRSYDSRPSRVNPHFCHNDIALAKLDVTQHFFPHRPLIWDVDPVHRDTELFLLGIGIDGDVEADKRFVEKSTRAAIGGWRYNKNIYLSNESFQYESDAALIWRCGQRTLRGLSGALLVKKGGILIDDLAEWRAVAFQSHEFPDSILATSQALAAAGDAASQRDLFWKIAYRPDDVLVKDFWAYAPDNLLRDLEVSAVRDRYLLL